MSTLWTKQHVKDMVGEVLDEINLMHLMPRELLQEDETSSFSSSASSDMGKEKEGEKEKGKGKEKQKDDEEEKGNEKKEVQKKDRKGKGKGRLVDDEANSPFKAYVNISCCCMNTNVPCLFNLKPLSSSVLLIPFLNVDPIQGPLPMSKWRRTSETYMMPWRWTSCFAFFGIINKGKILE